MARIEPELNEFEHENNAHALLRGGLALVGMLFVVALVVLLSQGLKINEYAMGSTCQDDCGRFELVGWVCMPNEQGDSYCTRRCDYAGEGCPDDMQCLPAKTDIVAQSLAGVEDASFCFRGAGNLARLAPASQPERVQTAVFEPFLIDVPR